MNINKKLKIIIFASLSLILMGIIFLAGINIYMVNFAKPYIYTEIADLPESYTVILPGARVYSNNISLVVRDRIDGGVNCLKNGKGQKILISGDHGQKEYDEVNQMRLYMQRIYGINPEIIFMDHAGFSTYETMYRARDIFCVDTAVVVTQKFHTARAVYIGRKLGLNVVGYEAPELNPFSRQIHASWNTRECVARVKAFFMVMLKSKPTYLGEQIPITGNSKNSWDMTE